MSTNNKSNPLLDDPANEQGTNGKQTKRQQIETYLNQRYKFRFNEITGAVEYTPKARNDYEELTDYKLNSLCRDLDVERALAIAPGTLLDFLKSDFVPSYHPLRDYFRTLPSVTGTATIEQLIGTLQTNNQETFGIALTRWLVATVANVLESRGCQNHTCLVLTGEQGAYKTTWLNNLCPKTLERYRFTGKIELHSKDTLVYLATLFIINIDDQLRELNKKDAETLKTLITHGDVLVRRPYDKIPSYMSRSASFCASVNSNDFLTDPTGSRRFMPFEVKQVDIELALSIDMNMVWAEAYALYKADFRYWFTKEETAEMFGGNEDFQVYSPEYELLHQYYEVVSDYEWANVQLTSTALLSELQNKSRLSLSSKKLGEALTKSNALRKTWQGTNGSKAWFLRERSSDEIEQRAKAYSPVWVPTNPVGSNGQSGNF